MIMGILTAIWGFLTSKIGGVVMALAFLTGLTYAVYHAGQESEKDSAQKSVQAAEDKAKIDVKKANDALQQYKENAKIQANQLAAKSAAAKKAQDGVVNGLQSQLDAAKKQHTVVKTIIKEVPTYVTAKSDANCIVPNGFISVFNRSLLANDSAVTGSGPGNADSPSGVALSTVAAVDADNNAECVERGKVIDLWIEWYEKNQAVVKGLNGG